MVQTGECDYLKGLLNDFSKKIDACNAEEWYVAPEPIRSGRQRRRNSIT